MAVHVNFPWGNRHTKTIFKIPKSGPRRYDPPLRTQIDQNMEKFHKTHMK